jgi:hypothetical protein
MIEDIAKFRRNSLKELAARVVCLDCSRFLIMVLCFGFLFLTFDSFLEHYFTQKEIRTYQWIPIVFGAVAFPLSLAAVVRLNPVTSRILGAVCLVSILVGAWGFYFHVAAIWQMIDFPFEWSFLFNALRYGPPMLAPLSFLGLGILGLVGAFGPSQLLNFLSKELCGKDFSVYLGTRALQAAARER